VQIYADKLSRQLQQSLSPLYLVASDDILRKNEACDEIKKAAAKQGYGERECFNYQSGFNWRDWLDHCNALSLFSDKKIVELQLPSSKIGSEGSSAIVQYAENPSPDTVLLIVAPRITGSPKWLKSVTANGVYIPIYPLDNKQLPGWLKNRAKGHKLTLAHDAAVLLADRVEGNLMAAAQELDKLALLLAENTVVDVKTVGRTVADSARFSAFDMIDNALGGNALAACRALRHLQQEGNEPPAVIGAVTHQLRLLLQLASYQRRNQLTQGFNALRIHRKKQPLMQKTLAQLDEVKIGELLILAAEADRCGKRADKQTSWDLIERILMTLAGQALAGKHPF